MSMNTESVRELVERMDGLHKAATPGEWTVDMRDWLGRPAQDLYLSGNEYTDDDGTRCRTGIAVVIRPETGSVVGKANADSIAALHNAWPRLRSLALRVEELEKALRTIAANHRKEEGFPYCVVCGAEGGRYPCATVLECQSALALTTDTQTQEPGR